MAKSLQLPDDLDPATLGDGDVPIYSTSAQRWVPGPGTGGGGGVTDASVAAVVDETATAAAIDARVDARAVSRGEIVIDPRDFGAVGDAHLRNGTGTDDTAAILAALDFAHSTTFIPASTARTIKLTGTFKVTGNLTITGYNVSMEGEGHGSGLHIVSGALTLDARAALMMGNAIRNMSIRRSGTPGAAVDVIGGHISGPELHPTRWTLEGLHITSPGGTCLRLRGTYLGLCSDLYLREAVTGLVIEGDPVSGLLSANAITFVGGEIQAVENIGRITHAIGICFIGMAWEGSSVSGMDVNKTKGLSIFGPYWEANAAYDLRVGNDGGFCAGLVVQGGSASTGAVVGKERSIILRYCYAVDITGMVFMDYAASPIVIDEVGGTELVRGSESNNWESNWHPISEKITSGLRWNEPPELPAHTHPEYAPIAQGINERTGTTYTLAAIDAGRIVTLENATAATITVPGSTFTAGQRVDVIQSGVGAVTFAAGAGMNLVSTPSLTTRARWSAVSVVFLSATAAVVIGDLATP